MNTQTLINPTSPVMKFLLERAAEWELKKLCISSFYEFTVHAWEHVDPRPYVDNWHIFVMCSYLETFAHTVMRNTPSTKHGGPWREGKTPIEEVAQRTLQPPKEPIDNLIINIPPGHAKSLVASVLFPAWVWLTYPSAKFLCESHSASLSTRDSVRCRDLLRSYWYQSFFNPRWAMKPDQDEKTYYVNSCFGWRFSVGVGSEATGWRPNFRITDDALDASAVASALKRSACIEWNDTKMSSRLQDLRRGHLVIAQRLHEDDLVGHLLRTRGDAYELLCLQAEYDGTSIPASANSLFEDPRQPGELLFPTVYDADSIALLKRALGSFGTAAQLQQRPVPREGGFFKHSWLRFFSPGEVSPLDFTQVFQSWDCAVEGESKNDKVAGQVWGKIREDHPVYANHFVLYDAVCSNADFVDNLRMIRSFSLKHPYAQQKLIEKKANGAPIIQLLKNELRDSHVVPFDPGSRSKEVRASAVSPAIEAGLVLLPKDAPWLEAYIEELTSFPRGKHDDQVDATTQALLHLTQGSEWVFSF